jgi:putative peptidoglycan lipid II flippase
MKTQPLDSTYSLFRSAKHFFSGTLLSRLSGMARDISITFAFGTTPEIAAFLLAFRLAHLFRRLFGEGALHSAFVPLFEDERSQGNGAAYRFFLHTQSGIATALLLLITLIIAGLGSAWAWLPLSKDIQEIIWLTLLMMPSLLFICLYGLNSAFLNCEKQYFIPGIAPVVFNLIWIMSALWLRSAVPTQAMHYLAISVILGCLFQWAVTLPSICSIFKKEQLAFTWSMLTPNFGSMRKFIKPLSWGIIGIAASQINNTLDVLFARYAHVEGPAYLWYAIRLQQLPLALFGISLAGALLPPLTRSIKESQPHVFFELLKFSLEKTFALMIPLSCALLALSGSSINLLYGRGLFTNDSTYETTLCLWGYGFGLLPMALILILAAVFYAQKNYRIPMISSILSMLLNLVLNAAMVGIFEWGSASIAIATSISAWVNLLYLLLALPKQIYAQILQALRLPFLKILGASTLALCCTSLFTHFVFQEMNVFSFLSQNHELYFPRDFSMQCLHFGVQLGCFLATLAVASWLCRSHEILGLFHRPIQQSVKI